MQPAFFRSRPSALRSWETWRRRGRLRLPEAPQLVDQAVTRDGIVGVQEQKRQEGVLLRTGDPHDPASSSTSSAPRDAELHAPLSPPLAGALGPAKRSVSPSGSYLQRPQAAVRKRRRRT